LSKTSWKKEEIKEKNPKKTLETLMHPVRVHKPNGGKKFEDNPKETKHMLTRLNHKAYQI
jgi:hypothetical protein